MLAVFTLGARKLAVSVRIRAAALRKCTADPMFAMIAWQVISWEQQSIFTLIDTRYEFYAMDAMSGKERASRGRRNIHTSANLHHKMCLCNNGCSNSKSFKKLFHASKAQASGGSTSTKSDYKSIVLRVRSPDLQFHPQQCIVALRFARLSVTFPSVPHSARFWTRVLRLAPISRKLSFHHFMAPKCQTYPCAYVVPGWIPPRWAR